MITTKANTNTVILNTKRWGKINVELSEVIYFARGIPGFEEFKQYAFFESEDIQPFQWLISIEKPELGFVVVAPQVVYPDYHPKLYQADLTELNVEHSDKIALFAIVTLAKNLLHSTVNLQGPLLINLSKRAGKQIVVIDDTLSVKCPILDFENDGSKKEKMVVGAYQQ